MKFLITFSLCLISFNIFAQTSHNYTVQLIEEDRFWQIIDQSLNNTNNVFDQEEYLIKAFEQLSPEELIGMRLRFEKLLRDSYSSHLWCACYIMNLGCSDDGFDYFRYWVISRGKEVFYASLENPDILFHQIENAKDEIYEMELLAHLDYTTFEKTTGADFYDVVKYEDFEKLVGSFPEIEFDWQEENPSSMQKICPQLFEFFMVEE